MGMYYGCVCDVCETELRLEHDISIPPGWTESHVRLNTGSTIVERDVMRCPKCSLSLFGNLYKSAGCLSPSRPALAELTGECDCFLVEELGQGPANDVAANLHTRECSIAYTIPSCRTPSGEAV